MISAYNLLFSLKGYTCLGKVNILSGSNEVHLQEDIKFPFKNNDLFPL